MSERKAETIERLIDAAMSILHHDACDIDMEYAWERDQLRRKFAAILIAKGAQLMTPPKSPPQPAVSVDLPTAFEAWWHGGPKDRFITKYDQRKQLAFDAFEAGHRLSAAPPADGVLPLEASKCHAVSDDAIKHLEIRSPLNRVIYKAIRDYRMGNMGDEDGYPYPLVDLMSNPAPSDIGTGEMEIIALADDVCEAVENAFSAAPKAPTAPIGDAGVQEAEMCDQPMHGLGPDAVTIDGDGFQDVHVLVGSLLILKQDGATICLPTARAPDLAKALAAPASDGLRSAGHALAMAAGDLNIATDGQKAIRAEREAVLKAMRAWADAIDQTQSEKES